MYSPFKNSPTILAIERANDLLQIGKTIKSVVDKTKKRSRGVVSQEESDIVFKEIVKELDYAELYPTFRTLVLERFYIILSQNSDHEYYNDICNIIVAFKHIITASDKMFYSGDSEDKKEIYYYLTDQLKLLLCGGQQIILLFHLSAQNS